MMESNNQTAIGIAFEAAGYEPPEAHKDKLHRLMVGAILSGKHVEELVIAAFIKMILAEDDPELIWELMTDVRITVVKRLFGMVDHQMRAEGQKAIDTRKGIYILDKVAAGMAQPTGERDGKADCGVGALDLVGASPSLDQLR